jgi:riboflavin kinase/FMN adenylyltransferase
VSEGKKNNCTTVVITFDPLPKSFFCDPDSPSMRLTSSYTRAERIALLGVDILIEYTFDQKFSEMSAADFICNILGGLNPKKLFIGKDFRFGYKGLGDSALLKLDGQKCGFETEILDFIDSKNERISSTRVRNTIKMGDLKLAAELMGKQHEISGRIVRGVDDLKVFFVPNYDLILPPPGDYIGNIETLNRNQFAMATIRDGNKFIEVVLDKLTISDVSRGNVTLNFWDSVKKTKLEKIKVKTYKGRHSILI